ncbi:hypothetical protein JXA34_03465 [Patescibacteria group bacterium]|nr:hypothetical protein [Patescibacteria group bacterium]
MDKKTTSFIILFFVMILLGILLVTQSNTSPDGNTAESTQSSNASEHTVREEMEDEHGCITSAGYTWCENKGKCLKEWEEACESTEAAKEESEETETIFDPTVEWKLYINNEYGYSFDFPSTCKLGPLPGECKQAPPEERELDCLCFLNNEDPSNIFFQTYTGEKPNLTLATLSVVHYNTDIYNPPEGTELIPWLTTHFAFEEVLEEENEEIGGTPAVRVYSPGGPGVYPSENIYFIKDNMLFNISLIDSDNEGNKELYNHIIDSFNF